MSSVPSALTSALRYGPEQFVDVVESLAQPSTAAETSWAVRTQRATKRLIDFIGAAIGLVLLSPVLLLAALAIRWESRGPILFRQVRLGLNGRRFQIYKFRTMVPDAEARLQELEHLNESEGHVLFKMRNDPRVTPIGRILRRTSLDELPQLINVLKGEMSLVGPRPLQIRDCQLLAEAEPEGFLRRHEVAPGLTGHWQVSDRNETGHAHMIRLDLEYIDNWTLGFDLRLLAQTVLTVVYGRGIW